MESQLKTIISILAELIADILTKEQKNKGEMKNECCNGQTDSCSNL